MDAPLIGPPDPRREPGNEIVVTAPCSASAEQGLLSGSYILDEERSDNVMDALNSAVDAMPPSVARPYFARRLRKAGAPVSQLRSYLKKEGSGSRTMRSDRSSFGRVERRLSGRRRTDRFSMYRHKQAVKPFRSRSMQSTTARGPQCIAAMVINW